MHVKSHCLDTSSTFTKVFLFALQANLIFTKPRRTSSMVSMLLAKETVLLTFRSCSNTSVNAVSHISLLSASLSFTFMTAEAWVWH